MSILRRRKKYVPSPAQMRARIIIDLIEDFEKEIYERRIRLKNEALDALGQQNGNMLGNGAITFMYKGNMYGASGYIIPKDANKRVHPAMLKSIAELIEKEDFKITLESSKIINYVAQVLVKAKCINDLNRLIPSRLHRPIGKIPSQLIDVFNVAQPMSDADVIAFKEKNSEGIAAFNYMFLEQLLLGE